MESHILLSEFDSIFNAWLGVIKEESLIPPDFKDTVRGQFIQYIVDIFPKGYFIDRNALSAILFNDEYYLMSSFFAKDRRLGYPDVIVYDDIIANIKRSKMPLLDVYIEGNIENKLNSIRPQIIKLTKFFKREFSSSQETLPEQVLKVYLEYLFDGEFRKTRSLDWLKGVKGTPLELDCYNDFLKIAAEFNGPQHYSFQHWLDVYFRKRDLTTEQINKGRVRFLRQVINDAIKNQRCYEQGVVLITISCFHDPRIVNWQDLICMQYELQTGRPAPNKPLLSYDQVLEIINREQMEDLRIKFLRNF